MRASETLYWVVVPSRRETSVRACERATESKATDAEARSSEPDGQTPAPVGALALFSASRVNFGAGSCVGWFAVLSRQTVVRRSRASVPRTTAAGRTDRTCTGCTSFRVRRHPRPPRRPARPAGGPFDLREVRHTRRAPRPQPKTRAAPHPRLSSLDGQALSAQRQSRQSGCFRSCSRGRPWKPTRRTVFCPGRLPGTVAPRALSRTRLLRPVRGASL